MCLGALDLGCIEVVLGYHDTSGRSNCHHKVQDELDGLRVNLHKGTYLR